MRTHALRPDHGRAVRPGVLPGLLAAALVVVGGAAVSIRAADADTAPDPPATAAQESSGETVQPAEPSTESAPPRPSSSSILDEVFTQGFIVPPPKPSDKSWLADPFGNIEKEMGLVVFNLEKGEVSRPVKVEQPQLIERFDQLIELLEKAQKSGSGSGPASPSPTNPAGESSLAAGPGGRGKMRAPGDSRRRWAELTPKEREKILQSRTQGFPAGYEELLQDYFLRLSTEEAVPDDNAPPKETK